MLEHRLRNQNDPVGLRVNGPPGKGDKPISRITISGLTVRQVEGNENEAVIGGYGLEWDDVYEAGWFTESFKKGAFAESLENDTYFIKVMHSRNRLPIARSGNTLEAEEDDRGLAFEARIDLRSPDALAAYIAIERGDIDKMSVAFWPLEENVIRDPKGVNPPHYEQIKVRLFEISIVDNPAYESSSVEPRVEPQKSRVKIDLKQRKLELEQFLSHSQSMN